MVKRPGSDHYEPIDWDDAFDLLADELRGLDSPDESLFYTSGRLSNEAAFLLQLFAHGLRHEQPARLLQHVSRVQWLAAERDAGHRQGHRQPGRHPRRRPDLRRRAEPGHQPSAHAVRTGGDQAERRKIVAVNPLPEAGLMRFKNPQKPAGRRPRHGIADQFLHIRAAATSPSSRP